jgi:hypothetical protein
MRMPGPDGTVGHAEHATFWQTAWFCDIKFKSPNGWGYRMKADPKKLADSIQPRLLSSGRRDEREANLP